MLDDKKMQMPLILLLNAYLTKMWTMTWEMIIKYLTCFCRG